MPLTIVHLAQIFHASNSDINGSLNLNTLIDSNLNSFAAKIQSICLAVFTEANFPNLYDTVSASAFDLPSLTKSVPLVRSPRRAALLDSAYFAQLTGVPIARGFPGGVHEISSWATAGASIVGAVCDPSAVIVGAGYAPPGPDGQTFRFIVPGLDLRASASTWFSTGTRGQWMSFDVMIGAGLGKAGSAALLNSA